MQNAVPLPAPVLAALTALEDAGFEAYIVGGCVRDALRGAVPYDYDVTTNALPQQVEAVFSGCRVIETGLKHGTVTVLSEGMPLEITTYRVDLGYSDGRHPDEVAFSRDLREDLARRDFTVNAMACDLRGALVDPFGGQADLAAKTLRCVGDPTARFTEDALRILRLLRFCAKLGFTAEAATEAAALALRERLQKVSAERIQKELSALLCGQDAGRVLVRYADILGVFLPELLPCRGFLQHNPNHAYDVLGHLAATVDAAPAEPVLRLAALLHDIAKPSCLVLDEQGVGHFHGHAKKSAQLADEILRRLRYDNDTRTQVTELIAYHDSPLSFPPQAQEQAVRRLLRKLGEEQFFRLLALKRADTAGQGVPHPKREALYDEVEALAKRLLASQACLQIRDLAVKGSDLLALGLPEGPAVGKALEALLDAVTDGLVPNEQSALLAYYEAHLA